MVAKKEETKTVLERTYNIPLRKEYHKVPRWKRTPKAVRAVKKFLVRHMKSEDPKLGPALNEKLWQHGMKNPPHHVKVTVIKDDKGLVRAELFGAKPREEEEKKKRKKGEKTREKKEEKEEVKEGEGKQE